MSGTKFDQEKVRFDLLPMDALHAIAYVMTMAVPGAKDKNGNDVLCGAQKYGDRNWEQGMDPQRMRGAQMRHDCSNQLGETRDESGHLHLAHKACDAIMELTYALRGITADESTWPANRTIPAGRPSKGMNEADHLGGKGPEVTECDYAAIFNSPVWNDFRAVCLEYKHDRISREEFENHLAYVKEIHPDYRELAKIEAEGNYSTESNSSEKASDGQGLPPL